jgi:hypothetical protein
MDESSWRCPVTELSSYPTELDAHVTLTDQRRIRIRALHRREERPIRVLHARLSPRTAIYGSCRRSPLCPMRWYAVSHAWTTVDVSRSSPKMRALLAPTSWRWRVSAPSTRRQRSWPSSFRMTGNDRASAPRSSPHCSMRRRSVVSTASSPPSRRTTRSSDGCSIVLAGSSAATRASAHLS